MENKQKEYTPEIFWKNTNDLIKQQNKTQRGLAIECGFTERRIENLSARNSFPDVHEALLIAIALGVTVERLATDNDLPDRTSDLKSRIQNVLDQF